jgi:hypothetical protein
MKLGDMPGGIKSNRQPSRLSAGFFDFFAILFAGFLLTLDTVMVRTPNHGESRTATSADPAMLCPQPLRQRRWSPPS